MSSDLENNPLLKIFETEFIPYKIIKNEHYFPSFEKAIKDSNNEFEKIINGKIPFSLSTFI